MINVITEYDDALFINDYRVPFVVKDSVAVDKENRQVTLTIAASDYFRVHEQIESEEIYKFSDERVTAEVVMDKEIITKNEKASIALDTDGKIVIDAKEITTGSINGEEIKISMVVNAQGLPELIKAGHEVLKKAAELETAIQQLNGIKVSLETELTYK